MARLRESEGDLFRRVSVRMHGDAKVRSLSRPPPNGETLWHHLLFGEQTGIIPGICRVGEAQFAEQLGWELKGFRQAFAEVLAQGLVKADWQARVVFVPNALKHNKPGNPNVITHWRRAWELIPECTLKCEAWQVFSEFLKPLPEAWSKAFAKACPKPWLNQVAGSRKQVAVEEAKETSAKGPLTFFSQEVLAGPAPAVPEKQTLLLPVASPLDSKGPAEQVFEHWRKVMRKNAGAKFDSKRRTAVEKQLKAGRTVADLCQAIDGCRASEWHMNNNQNGLGLIVRDAELVEKFMAMAGSSSAPLAFKHPLSHAPSQEETLDRSRREKAEFSQAKKLSREELAALSPFSKNTGGANVT